MIKGLIEEPTANAIIIRIPAMAEYKVRMVICIGPAQATWGIENAEYWLQTSIILIDV